MFAKQEDKLCNPGANIPLVQHKGSYLLSAPVVFIGHVVRYTQMGKKNYYQSFTSESKCNKNQGTLKNRFAESFPTMYRFSVKLSD